MPDMDTDEINAADVRVYAEFDRHYYGNPFLTRIAGRWFLVIEEDSGAPSGREVSPAFAQAWLTEFQPDA